MARTGLRHLVLVLGDQLDPESSAFDGFDPERDAVWMAEVPEESTHVRSHRARIAIFLSAMRHFRDGLRARGIEVEYRELDAADKSTTLADALTASVRRLRPQLLVMTEPGEWRVAQNLNVTAETLGLKLDVRPDRHFLCSRQEFAEHIEGRQQLVMEFFYRAMRKRLGVLMHNGKPVGGDWNYDAENRKSFPKGGPGLVPRPVTFPLDAITRDVLALVEKTFPDHPGGLDRFDWAVTRTDALRALEDFIENRLPLFGDFEDAMWTGEPYLYHARLSSALNLKLLNPREVIAAAERAYHQKRAPLAAVEGYIRQIIGWREYVRGIYWRFMPDYIELNALDAQEPLPSFYWTGQTEMNCLRRVVGQTLEYGFAHHIQRLMVTGLFALLLGVHPRRVHEWYLSVYVDAVEWVELPNVLGMSQFGDGGLLGTKPYAATGKYIQRMSDYCTGCRYDPALRTGPDACPFTTLYWDFLERHEELLSTNQRMTMQLKNLSRLSAEEKGLIREQASRIKHESAVSADLY